MTRLRIGVEQLGAEGFRLELAGSGGATNVIALAPGGGIQGRYEQDDTSIGLHGLRAQTLALSELAWALERGQLSGAARMHDVEIEAVIAVGAGRDERAPFVGLIRAGAIEATVDLRLGDIVLHGAHVRVEGFELVADAAGKLDMRVGSATASTIRGTIGPFQLVAEDVALPDLATLQGGTLRFESLSVGTLRVDLPGFGHMQTEKPDVDASIGAPARSALPPLPFVDLLQGHVHVDLTTDVSLPIIGSRQATHRFRIPIADGIVELGALSGSLSTLESLVLAFAVRGDKLVLEKDIPLLPFDNEALVHWLLDAEGLALAASERVRLSTLMRPQLAARDTADDPPRDKSKGKGVQLRQIDAAAIDIVLGVPDAFSIDVAEGRVELGGGGHPSVGELRVQGNLGHRPGDPPEGRLTASATAIHLATTGVRLGERRVDIGALHVHTLHELVLPFSGLRPQSLSTHATGLTCKKLELRRG